METTLDGALKAVFGTVQPVAEKVSAPGQSEELNQARKELEEAEKAVQKGRWEDFGKAMEELKKLLGQPAKRTK
jgi:DNA-binding GntR family transcriptional regulator